LSQNYEHGDRTGVPYDYISTSHFKHTKIALP